jgi:hypothetical protein
MVGELGEWLQELEEVHRRLDTLHGKLSNEFDPSTRSELAQDLDHTMHALRQVAHSIRNARGKTTKA